MESVNNLSDKFIYPHHTKEQYKYCPYPRYGSLYLNTLVYLPESSDTNIKPLKDLSYEEALNLLSFRHGLPKEGIINSKNKKSLKLGKVRILLPIMILLSMEGRGFNDLMDDIALTLIKEDDIKAVDSLPDATVLNRSFSLYANKDVKDRRKELLVINKMNDLESIWSNLQTNYKNEIAKLFDKDVSNITFSDLVNLFVRFPRYNKSSGIDNIELVLNVLALRIGGNSWYSISRVLKQREINLTSTYSHYLAGWVKIKVKQMKNK